MGPWTAAAASSPGPRPASDGCSARRSRPRCGRSPGSTSQPLDETRRTMANGASSGSGRFGRRPRRRHAAGRGGGCRHGSRRAARRHRRLVNNAGIYPAVPFEERRHTTSGAPHHGGEPRRHVPRHARRAARAAAVAGRADRQRASAVVWLGPPGMGRLHGVQGRRSSAWTRALQRPSWGRRHHGQRDHARHDPDGDRGVRTRRQRRTSTASSRPGDPARPAAGRPWSPRCSTWPTRARGFVTGATDERGRRLRQATDTGLSPCPTGGTPAEPPGTSPTASG
jgi:hypothetical protein